METAPLQPVEAPSAGDRTPCPTQWRAAEAPASPVRGRGRGKPGVMRAGSLSAQSHDCGDGSRAGGDRRRAGETAVLGAVAVGPWFLFSSRKRTHNVM